MELKYAKDLIETLEKHPFISRFDDQNRKFFLDSLITTPIPESTRFYVELPNNPEEAKLVSKTDDDYSHLSLRRVLRNGKAPGYEMSWLKAFWSDLLTQQGLFGSNALTRKLRESDEIVKMMCASRNPYSLLAKYETHSNTNDTNKPLVIKIRPLVIISGATDFGPILDWEQANMIYEKEEGLIWPLPKRISAEEYFNLT